MESIATTAQVVEEFPRPPAYFELFTIENKFPILPPEIPDSVTANDPYEELYSGVFSVSRLPFAQPSSEMLERSIEYKLELKLTLKNILKSSLPLISPTSVDPTEVVTWRENMRVALLEFHQLLTKYREHEAKEELYQTLVKQLEQAKDVKTKLQSCLERNEKALKQVLDKFPEHH